MRKTLVPHLSGWVRLRIVTREFAPFPDGIAPSAVPAKTNQITSLATLGESVEFDNIVYDSAQTMWYVIRDGETLRVQPAESLRLVEQ